MKKYIVSENAKTKGKQLLLLALPYLLTFFAMLGLAFCGTALIRQAAQNSFLAAFFRAPAFSGDTNSAPQENNLTGETAPLSSLPVMRWGDKWATISVDELPDASINDAPVYVGDDDATLKRGVGKYFGSDFCGEGGKIVLSAHCNRQFYCLEDMQVGYTVRLHTIYGEYVYRVDEIFLFETTEEYIIIKQAEQEQLLLYTCYPRGLGYRHQRIGVRCSKVSGVDFR